MSCMPAPIKAQGARPLQISLDTHAGKSLQTPKEDQAKAAGRKPVRRSLLPAPRMRLSLSLSLSAARVTTAHSCQFLQSSRGYTARVCGHRKQIQGAQAARVRGKGSPRGKTDVPYLTPARHQTTDVLIMYRVPHWTREMPTIDRSTANPFDGPSYLPCDDACQRKICVS